MEKTDAGNQPLSRNSGEVGCTVNGAQTPPGRDGEVIEQVGEWQNKGTEQSWCSGVSEHSALSSQIVRR